MQNQVPSMREIEKYSKEHFSPSSGKPIRLTHPVAIAVTDKSSPGKNGEWRKISMDLQKYAFMHSWQSW